MKPSLLPIAFLFMLWASGARGQSSFQRLMIPAVENATTDASGTILLTAYCLDPGRLWAPYGSRLNNAYYGQEQTLLTISENGKRSTVNLSQALATRKVNITSERQAIAINPAKTTIRLISVSTNGMAVGKIDEPFEYAMIMDNSGLWGKSDSWDAEQYLLHQSIVQNYFLNNPKKLKEYTENWIKRKDGEIRSANWDVSIDNNTIKIHERKGNPPHMPDPDSSPFDDIHNFLGNSFFDQFGDYNICVSYNTEDASFKATISGRYKGVMPVTIEFTSDFDFEASVEISKSSIGSNDKKSGTITFSRAMGNSNEDDRCVISKTFELCWPLEESNIKVESCGTQLSFFLSGIDFAF